MRIKHQLAVWGAALSLAATACPLYSADQDRTTNPDLNSQNSTRHHRSDKNLGQTERANKLIGKTVYGSDSQKLGKLDNLIVDLESGRVLYAVISTGTLGVGGHDYAVPPGAFTEITGDNARVNFDKQKLNGAPEFTKDVDKPDQIGSSAFVDKVYQFFGETAWWQGAASPNTGSFNNVHKAKDAVGMKVKDTSNQDLGKVDNLIIDLPGGRVVFAILNPDSSLNLGNNFYPLPPNALTLSSDQKDLVSDLNHDKLAAAPHFQKNQWPNFSNAAFASKIYQYYGKQPYFETTGGLQPTGRPTDQNYPKKKN